MTPFQFFRIRKGKAAVVIHGANHKVKDGDCAIVPWRAPGSAHLIATHRHISPLGWLSEVLEVSRSGFHAWLNRPVSVSAIDNSFKASDRTYGARRVQRASGRARR